MILNEGAEVSQGEAQAEGDAQDTTPGSEDTPKEGTSDAGDDATDPVGK